MNRFLKKMTAFAFATVMMLSLPLAVFADVKPQLKMVVESQDIKVGSEFKVKLEYGGADNMLAGTVLTYDAKKLELTDSGEKALKAKNDSAEVEETDGKVEYSNLNREGVEVTFKALSEGDVSLKGETEALYYIDSNTFMPDEELKNQVAEINLNLKSDKPAVNEPPANTPDKAPDTAKPVEPPKSDTPTPIPENQNMFQKFFNQVKSDWLLMVLFIAIILIVLILIILIIESIIKGRREKKRALTEAEDDAEDGNVRRVRRAEASNRPTLYDLTEVADAPRRATEAGVRPARRPARATDAGVPRRRPVGMEAEDELPLRRRPVRRRPDGTPIPRRRPVRRPVDADGNPLPPRRRPVDAQGNPLPPRRRPVDAEGNPLPVRRRPARAEGELPRRRPVRRRPDGTPMPRRRPAPRKPEQTDNTEE
ncbi:MAG: cohesin domain-containing protein [Eubacteriales bacterium]|nr:cohesin domain-containing protein [Eubacteriales bacterium]